MKATIYHNPRCSTSRQTLEMLRDAGADVTIIDYLQNPPSRAELERLFDRAGMTPREGLRTKEEAARPLADASDAAILDAMAEDPILIERPLVETEKGDRLARPKERVYDIL
jgi:arsenate reductase